MFWMACPAPPLIRLSVALKHDTKRVEPSTGPTTTPTSAKFDPATATTSGRRWAGTRTKGSWANPSRYSATMRSGSVSAGTRAKLVAKMPRASGADTGTKRSSKP